PLEPAARLPMSRCPSPKRLAAQSRRLLTASQPCSYPPHPPKIVTSSAWDHNCLQGPAPPLTNRSRAWRRWSQNSSQLGIFRHPSPLVTRLRTHSAPVHAHRWTRRVCLGPRARPGRTRRPARLPRPLGVPLHTAQTGGHSAARPGPVCLLDFVGLLAGLPL